eukprot:10172877-Alexandrium_andersonii.AAC.1
MWRVVDDAAGGHRQSLGPEWYHFAYHPADDHQRALPSNSHIRAMTEYIDSVWVWLRCAFMLRPCPQSTPRYETVSTAIAPYFFPLTSGLRLSSRDRRCVAVNSWMCRGRTVWPFRR